MFQKIFFTIVTVMSLHFTVRADLPSEIQAALTNGSVPVDPKRRDDLQGLYKANGFSPFFFKNGGNSSVDQNSFTVLRNLATAHGLTYENYFLPQYNNCQSKQSWIFCEIKFTEGILRLAVHMFRGQVLPSSVDLTEKKEKIKIKSKSFLKDVNGKVTDRYSQLVTALSAGMDSTAQYIESLAPTSLYYRQAKDAFTRLYGQLVSGQDFIAIANPGMDLSLGIRHPTVLQIKNTLRIMGYRITSLDDLYDEELQKYIKEIQLATLMMPTGKIETKRVEPKNPDDKQAARSLWTHFFNFSLRERVDQVRADMEKLRWLPQTMESKYIFVNLANQTLTLNENGRVTRKYLTVNGRTDLNKEDQSTLDDRQTPMMRNFISSMDMNPYWTVPMGIFGRDKLPRLRSIENKFSQDREARDAAVIKWFNNNHFDLVRDNGGNSGQWEVLSPLDVADWTQVTAGQLIGQGIYLRQKQGLNNALGTVRFNLNGDSSIYLHDTNEREMFDSPYRLRSSGCVRVQFATELASTLAQDSDLCDTQYCRESSNPQQEIKKMIPPYLQNDELKLTNVRLSKQVFVYLVFLTTTQERYFSSSPRGGVQFHFDFYGQNKMIFEAIARGLD